MIAGNFKDDFSTDTLKIRTGQNYIKGAYYFFDSFCVSTDSNYCNSINLLNEISETSFESIYPNSASDQINIHTKNLEELKIINIYGQIVYSYEFPSEEVFRIDTHDFPSGFYNILLKYNSNRINQIKIIIINNNP